MNSRLTIMFWLVASSLGAQSVVLAPASELTLNPPWNSPVMLELPEAGTYRLEATGLAGDPVEVILERLSSGQWEPRAGNRSGGLRAEVEWNAGLESWRVKPARTVNSTVILRLKKVVFSELRDALKQDLTAAPEVGLPLRKRLELPVGTGGTALAGATGPRGELWIGWLNAGRAEVWEAGKGRVGSLGPQTWNSIELQEGPLVVLGGADRQARVWSGLDWVVEALPVRGFTTPLGTFRYETTPPQVWKSSLTGWVDLALPRNRMDKVLMGSTEDGLYALLAASGTAARAFYLWQPGGWTALKPPPALAPPGAVWAATNGAGSLFHLEGHGTQLALRQFDGEDWRPPLDLSPLAPSGAVAAVLLPPSPWSKNGTLLLATDRVTVYDLP